MNEKNGWTKVLVGFLWAAIAGIIGFTGSVVNANDKKTVETFVEVRKEIEEKDKSIRQEVKADLEKISARQTVQDIKLERILTKLEVIERKVQ
jgi:hypothetical protein